jgi:hypothetical protein
MSKVSIAGDVNGTGVFTIASPNGNTNRTLTLPDASGTVVSTGSVAAVSQPMLASGIAGNGPLLVTNNATYITVSANTHTVFTAFPASVIDTASSFNVSNGRFTPNVAGYYSILAAVTFGNSGVTSVAASSQIYKNGSISTGILGSTVYSSGAYPTVQTSGFVFLNGSTDYVQVGVYIVTNGANNVGAQLQAALVRSAT